MCPYRRSIAGGSREPSGAKTAMPEVSGRRRLEHRAHMAACHRTVYPSRWTTLVLTTGFRCRGRTSIINAEISGYGNQSIIVVAINTLSQTVHCICSVFNFRICLWVTGPRIYIAANPLRWYMIMKVNIMHYNHYANEIYVINKCVRVYYMLSISVYKYMCNHICVEVKLKITLQ